MEKTIARIIQMKQIVLVVVIAMNNNFYVRKQNVVYQKIGYVMVNLIAVSMTIPMRINHDAMLLNHVYQIRAHVQMVFALILLNFAMANSIVLTMNGVITVVCIAFELVV